jgi:hypothetical protein
MWRERESNVFTLVHLVGTEVGFYRNLHARVSTAQLLPRFTPGSCQVGHNSDSQVPTTNSTAEPSPAQPRPAHHRGPGIEPFTSKPGPPFRSVKCPYLLTHYLVAELQQPSLVATLLEPLSEESCCYFCLSRTNLIPNW